VKPVSNLNGIGRAGACAFGVDAATIPCDHFYAGLLLQPTAELPCRSPWQQIDDAVPIKVNQDGAVVLSLLPCPVVDAQMPNRFAGADCTPTAYRSQNAVVTNGNSKAMQETTARQPARNIPNRADDLV